ncbi:winged helix-turn-helix transcriptional regulator [Acinetobacter radioresistens]|uniref:winged helix-turn-helix transcriptional regulator n=1 Tax=Acinetobacter radioresistens TaxID=40216 RepID=UPI0009461CB6|nr:winged helix-turn-helix transcriptional regulator [Acinetobacter radioresistens]
MKQLDRIDRKILEILQNDGRIPISELAEKVNLTATPCSERVKRLEKEGLIIGYYARLNPELLEKKLLVFLEIKLSAKSGEVFDEVAKNLSSLPEVLECHLISGDFDYLVKVRLQEMKEYRELLGTLLKKLPFSASSRSYIVMEEIKESIKLVI